MFRRKKEKKDRQSVNLDHGQCCLVNPEQVTFLRNLGEGQYGSVQLGEWKQPNVGTKYVAIKQLKNTHIDGVLSAMLKEAAIMQKLQNPYIVTFFGISLPQGEKPLKLVTEYASWGSLEQNLVKKNELVCKVSRLSKFAVQVAQGMQYLAGQQLVHRDLATRNILVFGPDLVKICDFGLARTLEGNGARELTVHQKLAVAWVPPETITRNLFTPKSDVWSYGVTLWEMFTFGEQPFNGLTFKQIKQVVNDDVVSYLSKPLACPDGFYDVMLSCWKRQPEQRPTFEAICRVVSQIQLKEGVTKTSHDSSKDDYLSYKCKQKVTLITRCEEGIILVQLENGSVGKVEEKNIKFSTKAPKEKSATVISPPFNVKKENPPNLIPELRKATSALLRESKCNLELPSNKQVERNQDEEVKPIHNRDERYILRLSDGEGEDTAGPAYPDPYPNMDLWPNQPAGHEFGSEPAMKPITSKSTDNQSDDDSTSQTREYETLQQDQAHENATEIEYMSMGYAAPSRDDEYASMGHVAPDEIAEDSSGLGCAAGSKISTGNNGNTDVDPGVGKPGSLLDNDTEIVNATFSRTTRPLRPPRPDRSYSESELQGVTQNENVYDMLWGGGGFQSDRSVNQKPSGPEIPARLDLVNGKETRRSERAASFGERKRPVPLPRQKKVTTMRPVSGGQFAKNTSVFGPDSTGCSDRFQQREALNHGSLAERTDADVRQVEKPLGRREDLPSGIADVKASQEGAGIIEGLSETIMGERLGVKGQNAGNRNEESESPLQLAAVQCRQGSTNSDLWEPETGYVLTEMAAFELNSHFLQKHKVEPCVGASSMTTPFVFDLASQHPSEIKTPPPLPPKLGNYLDPDYDEPLALSSSSSAVIHPAVLIQPSSSPRNPFALTPLRNTPNSNVYGSNDPQGQPKFDHLEARGALMSHDNDNNSEGLQQKILQIQGVCQDVTSDFCCAALLQHEGNVEKVIRVVKLSQLAKTTGKSYQFCERTLKHCNWDLDRAANYIMDNFADKEV